MKRWLILIVDVAGGVHDHSRFWTRWGAERHAYTVRSLLYDVILVGPDGAREILHQHMDPNEMLEHVRLTGHAPELFPHRRR